MRYLFILLVILAAACNTSSTEKAGESDSAKVDGTRLTDTLPPAIDTGL
jgi:hypothetical protein